MASFFKTFFAALLAILVALFIVVLIIFGVIASSVSNIKTEIDKKESVLSSPKILHLKIDNEIKDYQANPFESFDFFQMDLEKSGLTLYQYIQIIDNAKNDENIKGIYLEISPFFRSDSSNLFELRQALEDFRTSGKPVYAYSEVYSQGAYFLASVADSIFLNPAGLIEWKGISYEVAFLKGLLNKLEIDPQIIRHGKFKSAVEPFILEKMSDENRLQIKQLVNSIWNEIVEHVSKSRKISKDSLNLIANEILVRTPENAIAMKMVDMLAYKDQVDSIFNVKLNIPAESKTGKKAVVKDKFISASKYFKTIKKTYGNDRIAILYASGDIVDGKGEPNEISPERLVKYIKKLKDDEKIKAVILRVNSPGGSALASDIIWRELILLKKEKPLIVSMGNVAASGGYYISCMADELLATPLTITGSIGVFGIIPNMKQFYNNKLGITFDTVKTNLHSDLMTVNRPLTDFEKQVIQDGIEKIYDDFISKVAQGRNLKKSTVDSVGQGRVWAGVDAKHIGLVDQLGGLKMAIDIAKEKAGLDKKDIQVVTYPKTDNVWFEFFSSLNENVKETLAKHFFEEEYKTFRKIQNVKKIQGIQARCLICPEF